MVIGFTIGGVIVIVLTVLAFRLRQSWRRKRNSGLTVSRDNLLSKPELPDDQVTRNAEVDVPMLGGAEINELNEDAAISEMPANETQNVVELEATSRRSDGTETTYQKRVE